MSIKSYGLFCPLAKACEIIEPRWTLLILLEMAAGATRSMTSGATETDVR